MDKFTASNGYMISAGTHGIFIRDRGGFMIHDLGKYSAEAVREFIQAERDEELGRWRWPEGPAYVVYPRADYVQVVNEDSGNAAGVARDQVYAATGLYRAALAYFEAHPERKPWEDAKQEDVWLLTVNGDTGPFIAHDDSLMGLVFTASNGTRVQSNDDEQITAGRRIYPEAAS